jgi:hypothetical protein
MSNVPGNFSAFRLSKGCKLELIFAMTPTSINVADERERACRSWEWFSRMGVSIAGALSATASERVDGSLFDRPMIFGYASEANRYGRGMRSAVSASGSSSHDLCEISHCSWLLVLGLPTMMVDALLVPSPGWARLPRNHISQPMHSCVVASVPSQTPLVAWPWVFHSQRVSGSTWNRWNWSDRGRDCDYGCDRGSVRCTRHMASARRHAIVPFHSCRIDYVGGRNLSWVRS